MALILDNHILWKEIRGEILSLQEPLIEEIELFDLYSGRPIPEGKKRILESESIIVLTIRVLFPMNKSILFRRIC